MDVLSPWGAKAWSRVAVGLCALACSGLSAAAGDGQVADHYHLKLLASVDPDCVAPSPQLSANGQFLAGALWWSQPFLTCAELRSGLTRRQADSQTTRRLTGGPDEQLVAQAVSQDGRVTGLLDPSIGSEQAFVTGPRGHGVLRLSGLDSTGSEGRAVNRRGQVAGVARVPSGHRRAFVTEPNDTLMRDLGTLGGNEAWAHAINDLGQVVGHSQIAPGSSTVHAFLSAADGSGLIDLGSLGPYGSQALAVNRRGQVAGISYYDPTLYIAKGFLTDAGGQNPRLIEPLDGVSQFSAVALNAHGQVVGASFTRGRPFAEVHAIATGADGVGTVDLNDRVDLPAGHYLTLAVSISDAGDILASSVNRDNLGDRRWWLLCRKKGCPP
jgi:probable HAF family extracellular repeat protein